MTPDPEDDGVPPLSDIPRPMPPKFLCSTPLALEMMDDMVPECEGDQCTITPMVQPLREIEPTPDGWRQFVKDGPPLSEHSNDIPIAVMAKDERLKFKGGDNRC